MIRVLIVDDHPMLRRGLEQVLAEAWPGARCAGVPDAPAALDALAREPWDVVLVDLNLPGRDGLSLLSEIRRLHPQLPALVLTSLPEDEFAVRCMQLGAAGFLTKASAGDELVGAVKKVLAGGKYVTASLAEKLAALVGGDFERPAHEALSNRELQVLRLVATGLSSREIGAQLNVSEKTVTTYRARIADKLGISSNVELTRYALKHKLVD
ncbi:MAG: response regulator transcription factor [Anaeromyxobacter sp.]